MKNKQTLKALTHRVFIFRQWGRKNYSAFQSLNKVIIIAFLVVVYHMASEASNTFEIQDTAKTAFDVGLDEIEVSAQRAPVTYSQAARIISVMGRDEIEAAPAQSVQELLGFIPGVDIRKRGGEGVQADISIRGSSFDQVMILLNGINITDPQTGHHNLNLPVSLQQIQRIEVLEGSASRVFGPNAFSGAINIITKGQTGNRVSAGITSGENKYFNLDVSGSAQTGGANQYIAFNRKSSDGYIENTDFESNNIFYSLNADIGNDKLSAQFGYTEKAFGANSFYTPKYPDQFEEVRTFFSSLRWEFKSKIHLVPTVYWRRHFDRFELFRNEAPSWYTTHNYHRTDAAGAGVNAWAGTKFGKTAFGIEHRFEYILSNVLGEPLGKPVDVKGEDAQYTNSKARNISSLFLEHSYYNGKWMVSAGVLANVISDSKTGVNFFPGIDISYAISQSFKLYGSANRSLRMPTFTDLYYNGPTNVGNPDLKPETASSAEGGVKILGKTLNGSFTFFYRNGENSIDWVRKPGEEVWHTKNLTNLVSSGIEFKIGLNPQNTFGDNFPVSKIRFGYMYNNLGKKESGYISNYALDNLKHKLDFAVTHRIWKNISANWIILFQDRNGTYTEFVDGGYGNEVDYEPFFLFNGKVSYRAPLCTVFISASNIFNKEYYDIGNVVQAGRWVKAGIQFNVNFN